MSSDPDASPINPLPPVVVVLALAVFGFEVVLTAGMRGYIGGAEAIGWRQAAVQDFGFFSEVFEAMVRRNQWPAEHLLRFVTYPFVHYSFVHMLFVLVFLLALGKMVGEVFGAVAVLVVFFSSAIVGALFYALLTEATAPLIGGYPAVYGLIGAFTFILWVRLGSVGAPQSRAFTLIGVLLAIQLIFGLIFGSGSEWVAEIAGFGTGFLSSFLVSPGGAARLRDRLRRR